MSQQLSVSANQCLSTSVFGQHSVRPTQCSTNSVYQYQLKFLNGEKIERFSECPNFFSRGWVTTPIFHIFPENLFYNPTNPPERPERPERPFSSLDRLLSFYANLNGFSFNNVLKKLLERPNKKLLASKTKMSSSIVEKASVVAAVFRDPKKETFSQFSLYNWHPSGFCAIFSEMYMISRGKKDDLGHYFLTYCIGKMWVTRISKALDKR